eukprot:Gb_02006 [translate_table: standard]
MFGFDKLHVVATINEELFEEHLFLTIKDRVGPSKDEILGQTWIFLHTIERQFNHSYNVLDKTTLEGILGQKWVRSRTVVDSFSPKWNEQYTWERLGDEITTIKGCTEEVHPCLEKLKTLKIHHKVAGQERGEAAWRGSGIAGEDGREKWPEGKGRREPYEKKERGEGAREAPDWSRHSGTPSKDKMLMNRKVSTMLMRMYSLFNTLLYNMPSIRAKTSHRGAIVLHCSCLLRLRSEAAPLTDSIEIQALKTIAQKLGKKDWDFNVDPCSGKSWITQESQQSLLQNNVTCNCSFNNGTVCHVTNIILKRQNLSGVIPPELANLTYLQEIDLFLNNLTGSIPATLGSLTSLQKLSLGMNNLSGQIPKELGNLSNLRSL